MRYQIVKTMTTLLSPTALQTSGPKKRSALQREPLAPPLALFPLNHALFRLHFCARFAFPSLGVLVKANIHVHVTPALRLSVNFIW